MYATFLVSEFRSDAIKEFFKVDLTAEGFQVGDHVEDGGVLALEAQTLHGGFEFTGIYLSSGFGVEEIEGLSKFLDFVFSEPGALDFLLGRAFGWYSLPHNAILIKFKLNITITDLCTSVHLQTSIINLFLLTYNDATNISRGQAYPQRAHAPP